MSVKKGYAYAVCDLANRLINALQAESDDKFVDYIISEVADCGYCDLENYEGEISNEDDEYFDNEDFDGSDE